MKKVIFVASSGGHLSELLRLEKLFTEYEYRLVTEKTPVTEKMQEKYQMDFYLYGPNQNIIKYLWRVLRNIVKTISLLQKFKPDTIVSTGAQVGGIMCFFGKLWGAKIIYIESLAKADSLSVTGKNIYKMADKFYVQWESLAQKYEKAEYIGRLM